MTAATPKSHFAEDEAMHLESLAIARYLSGDAEIEERHEMERHLSRCEVCRDEVAAVAEVVERARPATRRKSLGAVAGVAVAAALAALFVLQPGLEERSVDAPIERDGGVPSGAERLSQIEVIEPPSGDEVDPDGLVFIWKPVGEEAVYRFTLTDAEGDLVWRVSVADTLYPLDPQAGVRGDATYFWYVDALLPGGETATTGTYRFHTRP